MGLFTDLQHLGICWTLNVGSGHQSTMVKNSGSELPTDRHTSCLPSWEHDCELVPWGRVYGSTLGFLWQTWGGLW